MSDRPVGREPITNRQLVQFVAFVAFGVAVVQGYTALLAESRITVMTMLLLVGVAIYALVFYLRHRPSLRMRAYAGLFVHVLTYLIVNGSFWIHAAILVLSGRREVLASGWSGPLIAMSVLWGIGLAAHTFGALMSKGYDDVAV